MYVLLWVHDTFNQQQVGLASCLDPVLLAMLLHRFALVVFQRMHMVGCFLRVSLVVLFPWVQDLHKPRGGHLHLGPMFSCGVTFAYGGS